MSKDVFVPPSDWPDTKTESDLGDLAEQAEGLRPRSQQAQAIMAEVVELLWLAQQTEIASRLAVWRAQGYRPPLIKGALPQSGKLGFKTTARAGDAAS